MCYKMLVKIEPDDGRAVMMHQRRVDSLEFLKGEINHNTYQVRLMEFGAELCEIYADIFDYENKKQKT